ncbi:MAG: hypothetical protein RMJ83_03620 [Armatimonadota bacterium]|nr:hypothetical protein [Armatimonadota bacterium]
MWGALAGVGVIHALALPQVFIDAPLRLDTDTAAMLDAVQRTGGLRGAWRWFVGDWLLENGFYRPLPSLTIALDYTLYGETAWGFRLTNWLIMVMAAWGAFCLTRLYARLVAAQYADALAVGVALAFSLQQTGILHRMVDWSAWWFVGLIVAGAQLLSRAGYARRSLPLANAESGSSGASREANGMPLASPKQAIWGWLFAVGALFWGIDRLLETQYGRLITWVPSRTALLGTAFSLWAMYWLLRGVLERRWQGLGLGGVLYLLALGSYEQSIMLVPLVGALVLWQRRDWRMWGWKAFGVVVFAALVVITLRLSLLPTELTRYQRQQLRSSLSGPLNSYLVELVPPAGDWQYWQSVGTDLTVLLVDKRGWDSLVGIFLYGGVLVAFWRWRRLLGSALSWHALTFLPMVFLHYFEHYMYLPQLGKTLFDVGLVAWGARTVWVQSASFNARGAPEHAQANSSRRS